MLQQSSLHCCGCTYRNPTTLSHLYPLSFALRTAAYTCPSILPPAASHNVYFFSFRDNRDRRVARDQKFNEEWAKAINFLQDEGIVKAPPAPLNQPSAPSSSSAEGDPVRKAQGRFETGDPGSVDKEAPPDPSGIPSIPPQHACTLFCHTSLPLTWI